ncbi:DEAD/DEAH box helicase [Lentzea sp. NBC_00516]|uniref:DEAD/DEAH box helicase n=1 Tax=Lentzea sp. NBC_00516 TaxID=2903582 RepID=UPI002E805196|nr:DEAD/DEAH box helicase [Lentzea sp. NBC_00516]WUD23162.1 DEAD/DEAH box helicase [Lentzea sp. NBC_00516]
MTAPGRYTPARNTLRRARIGQALNMQLAVEALRAREELLELLLRHADNADIRFDSLLEWQVDSVCSIAQVEAIEPDLDRLIVLLLCIRILANDGQFARMRTLKHRLRSIATRFEVERTYLYASTDALADILDGRTGRANARMSRVLGLERNSDATASETIAQPKTTENLHDLLGLAALHSAFSAADRTSLSNARKIAIASNNPVLLAFSDSVESLIDASAAASTIAHTSQNDPTFQTPQLQRYLAERGVDTLFPSQIHAIQAGITADVDKVVALPTSSGKTFIAELRIAATLARNPGCRAIYIAPYRLLSRQVETALRSGLRPLGYRVADLGSSYDTEGSSDSLAYGIPDVAVTTPERLDALLRLSTTTRAGSDEARQLLASTRVVVFDEIQLLGREGRGQKFELVLTRLRMSYPSIKVLGLAAATFGTEILADWISGDEPVTGARRPTGTIELRWETSGRIMQRVGNVESRITEISRSSASDDAAKLILQFDSEYAPILAVMVSRPLAESLARKVLRASPAAGRIWRDSLQASERELLDAAVEEVRTLLGDSHHLASLLQEGIAYHHAGLPAHVLRHIENLCASRIIRVLCATTTVAEGADLPFRVVVIPHLNFASSTNRLERDLYLNIVGRAGRAGVAMEGMVFVLETNARTLKNWVRNTLWNSAAPSAVTGRLDDLLSESTLSYSPEFEEFKTQVLAWIGEAGNQIDDQSSVLANATLTSRRDLGAARTVQSLVGTALRQLENEGLARSASPYALTDLGSRSRLAGLSSFSCRQLDQLIRGPYSSFFQSLIGIRQITEDQAIGIASLCLSSIESLANSLWLRVRHSNSDAAEYTLREIVAGRLAWPSSDEMYASDIRLLSQWIMGASYTALGQIAPTVPGGKGLFRGTDASKRSSDASEYLGRLALPTSWTWSAAKAMLGDTNDLIPVFVRQCIEQGVASETAVRLVTTGGMTRNAANIVASALGGDWILARTILIDLADDSLQGLSISTLDSQRLIRFQQQIRNGDFV